MKQIRLNVFETNSSSTHSLCICNEEEFKKWENGEILYNDYYEGKDLYTREEAIAKLKESDYYAEKIKTATEDEIDEMLREDGYLTYAEFTNDDCLEYFESSYTTKGGEKIVAFGHYGYDS